MTDLLSFASPLDWPADRPRTPEGERQASNFSRTVDRKPLTITAGRERLEEQLRTFARVHGAGGFILRSNLALTSTGKPVWNAASPADPGVVLCFTLGDAPHALACDNFRLVQDNMAALAHFLHGLRAGLRHGVMTLDGLLAGARCLPPPGEAAPAPPPGWREVLGLPPEASPAEARPARAAWMKTHGQDHPDAWRINHAVEQADQDARLAEGQRKDEASHG